MKSEMNRLTDIKDKMASVTSKREDRAWVVSWVEVST